MSRDQGVDPDELQFDGSDIERTLINQGTNDAMVREFMDKCRKDARGLPHKTIVFAVSHAHAKRLYQSFNRLFPELQRSGLAEIIDSHMERADETLDDFKYKTFPRVAISIDMLDTGIDVPAIQNLVFAKPVFSKVKFWQMIGRGTSSTIAPLMRLAPLAGLDELQFRVWCERLNLAWLRGDAEEQQRMRERIQSAATSLPDSIPVVHSSAELRAWIASDGF